MARIPGCATTAGTLNFKEGLKNTTSKNHFRLSQDLWVSSVGLGTYLGQYDEETDRRYEEAVGESLKRGCNVFDTAINYRLQRSERSIGAALSRAFADGRVTREEVIVATKGGFLSYDGLPPQDPVSFFTQTYVQTGIVESSDIVAGCHCMTPKYIENQVARSLSNLGLECIDIYYIHNPETQLSEVSRPEFYSRLRDTFQTLERLNAEGKIRMYGTATWNGFRVDPETQDYLSLEEMIQTAEEAGGSNHHFRVVQLPFNLAMAEAFTLQNQELEGEKLSLLEAAARQGIMVIGSASIFQGKLSDKLPEFLRKSLKGLETDAQRAIQFARSTPGLAVALVGMSQIVHVEENMTLTGIDPVDQETYLGLYSRV